MKKMLTLSCVVLLALTVVACGKKGDLEAPERTSSFSQE
ncbi:LPS translocon maturation chaperone LptM [Temperatibacter marinus]